MAQRERIGAPPLRWWHGLKLVMQALRYKNVSTSGLRRRGASVTAVDVHGPTEQRQPQETALGVGQPTLPTPDDSRAATTTQPVDQRCRQRPAAGGAHTAQNSLRTRKAGPRQKQPACSAAPDAHADPGDAREAPQTVSRSVSCSASEPRRPRRPTGIPTATWAWLDARNL